MLMLLSSVLSLVVIALSIRTMWSCERLTRALKDEVAAKDELIAALEHNVAALEHKTQALQALIVEQDKALVLYRRVSPPRRIIPDPEN